MATMKWSSRARRDFKEREEYRKRNDEKDRYEKSGESKDEKEDKEEKYYDLTPDEVMKADVRATLLNIRDSNPGVDVNREIEKLLRKYYYYEEELDKYDSDYDDLMKQYEKLKEDNRRYMLRATNNDIRAIDKSQEQDIKEDNEIKSYDDLWKEREE